MIRPIRVTEGVQAIRADLDTTRSRLAKEAQGLAGRIQALIDELDALSAQAPAGGAVDGPSLASFVARANTERCTIFGELVGNACAAGRGTDWAKRFFRSSSRRVPRTVQDWTDVALERAADAKALGNGRPNSVGPVYMAGYAIECSLKAYLHLTKKHVPTSGREGHHLHGLWEAAGFRLSDLRNDQAQIFYLERWSTDLRYDALESVSIRGSSLSKAELLRGAQQLTGWIQKQVRRKGSAR